MLPSAPMISGEDDYVGTRVGVTDAPLTEFIQPARGHLGYFSDPDVVPIIVEAIR